MRNANEIAAEIRAHDYWDEDLIKELVEAADMEEEYDAADGDSFEAVVFAAAEKLGVEI